MFEAVVVKVLISSPGDTGEEVAAVKESLHGWNGSRAEAAQVILLPRHGGLMLYRASAPQAARA